MPESFPIKVGMVDTIYHKWMYDSLPIGDIDNNFVVDNVLCFQVNKPEKKLDIFVALKNADVTCQECLELIHA